MTANGPTDAHVTTMGDDRPVTTVTKNDVSATIETVATAEGRIEAEADRTPTKTTIGTAQRATTPTLHGAPCATGVEPPARAVAKAPATNHASTTVPREVATAVTGAGNNATDGRVRSTTTTGIVLPATTPISPSDNRATDAMHPAPEGAPTTADHKATATAEGTVEVGETGSLEVGVTTATVVGPTVVSDATVTGHRVADETIAAVAGPTVVSDATEVGRTALVAMNDKTGAVGIAPTTVSDATEAGRTALVAMIDKTGAVEIDQAGATATNETMAGEAATSDHNSNAPRVRVTVERVGSVRAMRTTVSPGISGTDLVGSVEAMTIDRGAAA